MFRTKLIESPGYDSPRLDKLKRALGLIERIINTSEFKSEVLSWKFHFRRNPITRRWIDTPYSNEEIYSIIMQAKEDPSNDEEGVMDLYLHLLDDSDGDVVGYGNPDEKEIYTYKPMFDKMSEAGIANHITHEWTHKLGFTHAVYTLPHVGQRDHSVPYAIGEIIEKLA